MIERGWIAVMLAVTVLAGTARAQEAELVRVLKKNIANLETKIANDDLSDASKRAYVRERDFLKRRVRLMNPLFLEEGYLEALDTLRECRNKLETTTDAAEATRLLDQMSRAILEARRVVWEVERAKKKDGEGPIDRREPER